MEAEQVVTPRTLVGYMYNPKACCAKCKQPLTPLPLHRFLMGTDRYCRECFLKAQPHMLDILRKLHKDSYYEVSVLD